MQYQFQDAFQNILLFDKVHKQDILNIGALYLFRYSKATSLYFVMHAMRCNTVNLMIHFDVTLNNKCTR